MGSSRPSRISPRWRLVNGTSAVGTRYRSQSPAILNKSCSNFGRFPVPCSAALLTRYGGTISRYPCSRVCRSSMKLISARDIRAALEVDDAERRSEIPVRNRRKIEGAWLTVAPDLHVVGRGLANRHGLVRQVRQDDDGRLALVLDGVQLQPHLLDLLRARPVCLLHGRGVFPLALRPRDLVARRVLLALQPLEFR